MDLSNSEIKSLKIIAHYTELQGYVGLSVLERKLFDEIGFEYALQNNIKVVEITRHLADIGFIEKEGLANRITRDGLAYIKQLMA